MQAFGVLDRYIGKTIFTTIMMTLFMLVSLSGIIKFVDQLKKPGRGVTMRWVPGCTPAQRTKRCADLLPDGGPAGALLGWGCWLSVASWW